VIAIIWLDRDLSANNRSIESGINMAKAYPNTIVRLSCGSEVRTRHGRSLDNEIIKCINRLRAAGVSQPITTIDTWWEWCNRSWQCQKSGLYNYVDWIGVYIFPWWENKYSGIIPCTTAVEAADFHVAQLQRVMLKYPDKEVILTEFGWPAGPDPKNDRSAIISKIKKELVLTKAGALSYFYKFQKESGNVTEKPPSKMDKAKEVYEKMTLDGKSRKEIIAAFVKDVGLTDAGASTYYQNLKKLAAKPAKS